MSLDDPVCSCNSSHTPPPEVPRLLDRQHVMLKPYGVCPVLVYNLLLDGVAKYKSHYQSYTTVVREYKKDYSLSLTVCPPDMQEPVTVYINVYRGQAAGRAGVIEFQRWVGDLITLRSICLFLLNSSLNLKDEHGKQLLLEKEPDPFYDPYAQFTCTSEKDESKECALDKEQTVDFQFKEKETLVHGQVTIPETDLRERGSSALSGGEFE